MSKNTNELKIIVKAWFLPDKRENDSSASFRFFHVFWGPSDDSGTFDNSWEKDRNIYFF